MFVSQANTLRLGVNGVWTISCEATPKKNAQVLATACDRAEVEIDQDARVARRVDRFSNTLLKTLAAVRTGGGGTYLTPLVAGKLAGALTQAERLTPR
jgi:hypothetical protein